MVNKYVVGTEKAKTPVTLYYIITSWFYRIYYWSFYMYRHFKMLYPRMCDVVFFIAVYHELPVNNLDYINSPSILCKKYSTKGIIWFHILWNNMTYKTYDQWSHWYVNKMWNIHCNLQVHNILYSLYIL